MLGLKRRPACLGIARCGEFQEGVARYGEGHQKAACVTVQPRLSHVVLLRFLARRFFHQLIVDQLVGIRRKREITAERAVQFYDYKDDHAHECCQQDYECLVIPYVFDPEEE